MKALEKAAQERDKTPAAPAKFSLENVDVKPAADTQPVEVDNTSAPPNVANSTKASGRSSLTGASAVAAGDSSAQTRAAAVLTATATPGAASGAVPKWLTNPVYLIGSLGGLAMICYGAYVYVQIAHPGLLVKSPPRAQAPSATGPTAPSLTTSPPSPSAVTPPPTEAPPGMVTMQSVLSSRSPTDLPAPAASAPSTTATVPPQPAAAPAAQQSGVLPAAKPAITPATSLSPPAPGPAPVATTRVAISQGDTAAPRINAQINDAYNALVARQFDSARQLYQQALRAEPGNVDALLGLAAIAQHDNRPDEAQRHFMAILNIDPRNALAQAGLAAMIGRADPQAAETRLKQLIAREPSAPLYFNLGNVHAEQGQWPQAQQAYFQAHNLDPRNPDYAYNLAVGLEHLGQQKIALDYYRKALQLATDKGAVNFDTARIQARIAQLSAQIR